MLERVPRVGRTLDEVVERVLRAAKEAGRMVGRGHSRREKGWSRGVLGGESSGGECFEHRVREVRCGIVVRLSRDREGASGNVKGFGWFASLEVG